MTNPKLDEALKPLVWEQLSDSLRAITLSDEYFIYKGRFGWWHVFASGGKFSKKVRSLEAAQLAARQYFVAAVEGCFVKGVWG